MRGEKWRRECEIGGYLQGGFVKNECIECNILSIHCQKNMVKSCWLVADLPKKRNEYDQNIPKSDI